MQNPQRIFATLSAFQQTQALQAAIKLDLFTAVDKGAQTVSTLAESCNASERGIRILADYMVILEFLKKEKNIYSLTDEAKFFLSRNSPAYVGGVTRFLNSQMIKECFNDLDQVVRKGGTLLSGEGSVDPENPIWVDFAHAMAPMMQPAATAIAKMLNLNKDANINVLDIAAGHGVFGIAIAKAYPKVSVAALDWKSVLEVAMKNAIAAGVQNRYRLMPGSAFELPLEEQYDVVLITNFLHHFDIPICEEFLKKVHNALRPGGRAVTLEFVPNEDRVTPIAEAAFSLVMLASTQAGDAYTFKEYEKMFSTAGFVKSEIHSLDVSPEHVIISTK